MNLAVVVGAARSGTRLLRDSLAAHTNVAAVPYDINFVWRPRSWKLDHDEIPARFATPGARARVVRQLRRFDSAHVLVEKTVSNTLRVPYVDTLFPDARFVHLVRDGLDVVESSLRQWTAPTDWAYSRQKLQTFPFALGSRYFVRAASGTLRRIRGGGKDRTPPMWGPVYDGMQQDLQTLGLVPTVARQWRECVEQSRDALAALPDHRKVEVRYEEFIESPSACLDKIARFLDVPGGEFSGPGPQVERTYRGRGLQGLPDDDLEIVLAEIGPLRARLGYEQRIR